VTQKVAIITDSIACLTPEMVRQYQVQILPINLYFGDKVYREGVDITPTEAYELFLKNPKYFATSAPSPAECLEAHRKASKQTTDILCITVSSKLSMVYESSLLAKEQAKTELPQTSIEIVDSHTATATEGFIALAGARAASILNIRPILTISSGVVRFKGAVRNKEHGISQLLGKMRDRVGQNPTHVAVMHAYAQEEAEKLKERVSAEFNCAEIWLSEFSPVMGYAYGTGTLGLAFYWDSKE